MATSLPGKYDLAVYRGDTKQITVDFTDENDAPVNMAGWTWLSQVRPSLDEPETILATLDVDDTSAATGQLTVTLSAAESANLITPDSTGAAGRATYYWDLQATDADVVKTWLAGKVKVTGDVSVSA